MGNNPSLATEEPNEAAVREALEIFKLLDINKDQSLGKDEWKQGFQALDENADGSISRKEWYLKQGTTEMYDAIFKKAVGNITREDWDAAFDALDTNGDGLISVAEWYSRRKVRIAFYPLGMTVNNLGVAVGDDFYEVLSTHWQQHEMVVAGPNGIVALGEFSKEEGAKEKWFEAFKADIEQGKKPEGMWQEEKGEPKSRPEGAWQDIEIVGWTMKTAEEIEAWIFEWVEEHPQFKAIDAIGRECNVQTFALELISWLTNSRYSRLTDNTKGRAVVYGGFALIAGAGICLANRMNKRKADASAEEPVRERTTSWHEGGGSDAGSRIIITGCEERTPPQQKGKGHRTLEAGGNMSASRLAGMRLKAGRFHD